MQTFIQYCPQCQKPTQMKIDYVGIEEAGPEGPPVDVEHTAAHCVSCKLPLIFTRDDMTNHGHFELDEYYRRYPSQSRSLHFAVPTVVQDSYQEAVRCENAGAWLATVVMVGRTLEGVCKEHAPNTKTIFDGLKAMHTAGIISSELLEWGDALRILRNIGAHATQRRVPPADAKEALDFLQAILEILYDLRPRFQKFKQRHPPKPAAAAPAQASAATPTPAPNGAATSTS